MKNIRKISVIICIMLAATLLASCAKAAADIEFSNDALFDSTEDMNMMTKPTESPSLDNGLSGMGADGAVSDSAATGDYPRKIIKTVDMTAETKQYDQAIDALSAVITAQGGYIEASSTNGKSYNNYGTYRRFASYTIRIPAENLDAFLGGIGEFLNVTSNNAAQNDVSGKYYDIVSRLETLNAEKTALMAMYEKAESIDYMLQVQQRLYDVIEEIEAYTTTLKYYDGQVSYSTVRLNVNEVIEYTDISDPITYGERIVDAFKDSWRDFAVSCQDFSVNFVRAIPTLLVIAVIGCGAAALIVFTVRRAKARRASGSEDSQSN